MNKVFKTLKKHDFASVKVTEDKIYLGVDLRLAGMYNGLNFTCANKINFPQGSYKALDFKKLVKPRLWVFSKSDNGDVVAYGPKRKRIVIHAEAPDPHLAEVTEGKKIELPCLEEAIKSVSHCIGENESRKNLMGLHVKKGFYQGADAFRIARYPAQIEDDLNLIIPKKYLKAIPTTPGTVYSYDENYFTAVDGDFKLSIRLIDADYPDLDSLLKPQPLIFEVNRLELLDIFKAAFELHGKNQDNVVKITGLDFSIQVKTQNIKSCRTQTWEARGEVHKFEPLAVNVKFFIDALKAMKSESVMVGQSKQYAPINLNGLDDKFSQVVMPVKIKW